MQTRTINRWNMKRIRNFWVLCLYSAIVAVSSIATTFGTASAQQKQFQEMAPEDCWVYSFWDAAVKNDPNSKNESERLLAEPEIQAFIDDIIKRVGLLGPAMMTSDTPKRQKLIKSIGPKISNIIFKRSGCFCLEKVNLSRDESRIRAKAFLCLDAGGDAKSLASELSQLFSRPNQKPEKVTLSKISFDKFLLNEKPKFELFVGASDSTLILAIGEQSVTDALARIGSGKTATWMANINSNKNTKRLTNFSYFNVKEIRETATPLSDPQVMAVIGMLGLGNVDSLETSSGLTQDQSFSRMLLKIDGQPKGLLDLYSQKGLLLNDLKSIPDDSLFALALSIEPKRVFKMMRTFAMQMNRRGRDELGEAIREFKKETGVDFKSEVIDNLGDAWTIYNGAGDGWFSGLTLTCSVKSSEKLSKAVNTFIKRAIIETEGEYYAPKFQKRKIGSDEVFSFRIQGQPLPVHPSWCISGDRLIVGLFPQAVESALKQDNVTSLVDQTKISELSRPFSDGQSESKIIGFIYGDTKTQFPFMYPYGQMALSMSESMVDEMPIPRQSRRSVATLLRGMGMPPARTIYKHLGPTTGFVRLIDDGIEFETLQTIPSVDAGYAAPVLVGMLLPAVQQVRGAARRTASMNNARQLALASLNFESAYMSFPAKYTVDGKGKKLLSWRVHILPFVEESKLYEQFKLDEPWDSDHNKKLIEKMPKLLRSPMSSAKPGMTVYRSFGGKAAVLAEPKKPNSPQGSVGFGKITDGSSNTALLVETSDELAQVWTKPDEGVTADDIKKIFGTYPGGTIFTMCDGSVHFVNENIDKASLKNLMERNDGNIIDIDMFRANQSTRSRRNSLEEAEKSPVDPIFNIDGGAIELSIDNMLSKEEKIEYEKRKRIREIALACHNFHSAHQSFPSAYSTDGTGKPLLSWRVHLLPYLGENRLYNQFKLDEPWDSDHNKALLGKIPEVFNMAEGQLGEGETTVRAMGGPSGVITSSTKKGDRSLTGVGFEAITDGSSNTLMLVNVPNELAVEWTKPSEFDPDDDVIKLILSQKFTAAIADGSLQRFSENVTIDDFKEIWTRDGGEIVDLQEMVTK